MLSACLMLSYVCILFFSAPALGSEIFYVIEPFESAFQCWSPRNDRNDNGLNITLTDNGVQFGSSALRVEYNVSMTQDGGGLKSFGHILDGLSHHSCIGATHLSLWYKVIEPQSLTGSVHLRVVLLDDSDCEVNCTVPQNLERYYSDHYILDSGRLSVENETSELDYEWRELRINLDEGAQSTSGFSQAKSSGLNGNGILDLDHIKGWQIELAMDDATAVDRVSEGILVFDQISCVGGEDLFGSALLTTGSFRDAVADAVWGEEYFESTLSKNATEVLLDNSTMTINYTLEQAEIWGGFAGFDHVPPGNAYYNLSQATAISLDYEVMRAASTPGRAHFRIILHEASNATAECHPVATTTFESYYSFHYCLDDDSSDSRTGSIVVPLTGSTDAASPFWLTGWIGIVGNGAFNSDIIKGFRFELNVDSQGGIGSIVEGEIALRNLKATFDDNRNQSGTESADSPRCVVEPGFMFDVTGQDNLLWVEFKGGECGEICEVDSECLYALSSGQDCYLSTSINPDSTDIVDSTTGLSRFIACWADDSSKRGDFCERCECNESEQSIDCRDKNLLIPPKTFSSKAWTPRVLDLRGNPNLTLVGTGALASVTGALEELRLPSSLRHMGLQNVTDFPSLRIVLIEEDESRQERETDAIGMLNNVIIDSSTSFLDVCCGMGMHLDLVEPAEGLTFCEMKDDVIGADAVYEDFVQYYFGEQLALISPSSNFLAEAAESAEKCAEYCTIHDGCQFFSFDRRWKNAESLCYLLATNGTVTPTPDQYGDEKGTLPGWTSGRVARARHVLDDARVLISVQKLFISAKSGLSAEFALSLGSAPLRGAVWIEPMLASSTHLNVSFTPTRVVLYDNITWATIGVTVQSSNSFEMKETIIVTNKVSACDTAFTSTADFDLDVTVYIDVAQPGDSMALLTATLVSSMMVAIILVICYVDRRRRRSGALWKVKLSELHFDDPPAIVGHGTFGVVLLAEYRGTQVAVKRIAVPLYQSEESENTVGLRSVADSGKGEFCIESGLLDSTTQSDHGSRRSSGSVNGRSRLQSGLRSKVLPIYQMTKSRDDFSRGRARFIAEVRHLSSLRHPCITTVMGAVINKKEDLMLILEYMDHGSLHNLLHNETMAIDADIILPILRDVAQGVRFLHAAETQVVHCDLKAQNILVDGRLRAKVADFGLSLKKQAKGAIGTPYWMAPELLRGESLNTTASDVYSFGVILYEVYSRRDPYEGEDYDEVLTLVADPNVNKRPPIPPSCPPEIVGLMNTCLGSCPVMRPTFEQLDIRLKSLELASIEPGETRFSMQAKKAKQTDILLHDVFPRHIVEALRNGRKVEPELREMVTIFFSDIVGFTRISSSLPPIKVSDMLDRLYSRFDELSRQYDIFKVETIGDAYMAVTNLIKDQDDHAKRIAEFSVDALTAANETLIDLDDPSKGYVNVRIGIHSGPAVANVVGSRNPRYCLFGDTVNTASRMECHSLANRIHCSQETAQLLRVQIPEIKLLSRGSINVKGKGEMQTYWVNEDSPVVPRNGGMLRSSSDRVGWETTPKPPGGMGQTNDTCRSTTLECVSEGAPATNMQYEGYRSNT
ncbi:guanylate cyclase [Fragilaria crotonensis]|nr:guanylate cyclase [Fragilaria crotonensis]